MIAFEHGALRGRGEPLLAGILESSDAQAINFLAHAERLTGEEWAAVLTNARELRAQNSEAAGVVRFADAVVTELTAASFAIERRSELGTVDVAQLYAPFEPVIPLDSLG